MNKFLRKLARSVYWQNFYIQAKELGNLSLFINKKQLSKIQIYFLHWLSVYNSLYTDLSSEEDYISQEVIDDDIRTDAYLFWRRTVKDKTNKKKEDDKEVDNTLGIPSIKFEEKRKKVKNDK